MDPISSNRVYDPNPIQQSGVDSSGKILESFDESAAAILGNKDLSNAEKSSQLKELYDKGVSEFKNDPSISRPNKEVGLILLYKKYTEARESVSYIPDFPPSNRPFGMK